MTSEIEMRKRAYQYMFEEAKKLLWTPSIDSDERLADTLDISLNELTSLKEGLSNPSAKMITTFKSLVCPMVSETDVDLYLVKPFKGK
jgi:hypothetical protein